MNLQVVEKQEDLTSPDLLVHHIFYTIQGEGPFAGTPAVFIRLSGCNLQCPYCDTDYTSQRNKMSPAEIYKAVKDLIPQRIWDEPSCPLVVISGGEPFRQNLGPTVNHLAGGFHVQIETNGTLYLPAWEIEENGFPYRHESVTIVCSPKTPKINSELQNHIAAYKYIIESEHVDQRDGLPTCSLGFPVGLGVARPPENWQDKGIEVFVQPCDQGMTDYNERNLRAAIDSSMQFGYTLCIQMQKLIGLE